MLADIQYKLIALVKNFFKDTVTKLFYGNGYIEFVVVENDPVTKKDVTKTIKVPTIRQVVIDNVGPADLTTGTYLAGENISLYDAVYYKQNEGKVYRANNTSLSTSQVVGIALNSANIDEPVTVTSAGEIKNSNWNWNVGLPVYLKTSGNYDQTFPSFNTYIVKIGTATAADTIQLQITQPILNAVQ